MEGNKGADENGENAPEGGEGASPGESPVKTTEVEKKPDLVKEKPDPGNPESTEGASGEVKAKPKVEPVMVEMSSDPIADVVEQAKDFGVKTAAFLLMVLFTLAYGNRILNCLNEDAATETILGKMGEDVSRYLFTITAINGVLGLCIGLAMWALGMPNPALWGILGMVLNFIPYVGALIGTAVVFLIAAATFDSPGPVLMVPVVYFGLTAMEGNLVTPLLLGRRFLLNPLVVFVWIFAWAAFWGIAGMLIAMPSLVIFKIVCENTATMERFRRLLSA